MKKQSKKKKKPQYADTWILYTDTFQIHWVNGVAVELEVGGKLFKATH